MSRWLRRPRRRRRRRRRLSGAPGRPRSVGGQHAVVAAPRKVRTAISVVSRANVAPPTASPTARLPDRAGPRLTRCRRPHRRRSPRRAPPRRAAAARGAIGTLALSEPPGQQHVACRAPSEHVRADRAVRVFRDRSSAPAASSARDREDRDGHAAQSGRGRSGKPTEMEARHRRCCSSSRHRRQESRLRRHDPVGEGLDRRLEEGEGGNDGDEARGRGPARRRRRTTAAAGGRRPTRRRSQVAQDERAK